MAGLETPDSGRVIWRGEDITAAEPGQRDLAMVFQHDALLPHLTIAQNLGLGLKLRHASRASIEQNVREIAKRMELDGCLDRLPKDLSGGQRQRAALGRALARKPGIFLFDEPLASLDEPLRVQMRQEIRRLHAETGATSVYVTHDQTEAMALGHRVAMISNGRLLQVDRPQVLYEQPANRAVAAFFGSPAMNFFAGQIEIQSGQHVFISASQGIKWNLPPELAARLQNHIGKPVVMGLRPENLRPAIEAPAQAGLATVKGTLWASEPQGPHALWHAQIGPQTVIALANAELTVSPGCEITLGLELLKSHWFDAPTGERIPGL